MQVQILFPGFEPLDVYGPLQILFTVKTLMSTTKDGPNNPQMSAFYKMTLSLIASDVGPVNARMTQHRLSPTRPLSDWGFTFGPSTTATHTFLDAPALDVIFIPGGMGAVTLEQNNDTAISTFLARRQRNAEYILSVSGGALLLALSGLLAGKRATTNKSLWAYATDLKNGENITWVPNARWTEDGQVWTSSGVAAGLDMTYAFMKKMYGTEMLDRVMDIIEYAPHRDASWDPYAVVHNVSLWRLLCCADTAGYGMLTTVKVPGANANGSWSDCVSPFGDLTTAK